MRKKAKVHSLYPFGVKSFISAKSISGSARFLTWSRSGTARPLEPLRSVSRVCGLEEASIVLPPLLRLMLLLYNSLQKRLFWSEHNRRCHCVRETRFWMSQSFPNSSINPIMRISLRILMVFMAFMAVEAAQEAEKTPADQSIKGEYTNHDHCACRLCCEFVIKLGRNLFWLGFCKSLGRIPLCICRRRREEHNMRENKLQKLLLIIQAADKNLNTKCTSH